MSKQKIIKKLKQKNPRLPKIIIEEILDTFISSLSAALVNKKSVELRDFGTFFIKQIAEKKLTELPVNFVVFATTSQIVENIGEGLRRIKTMNKERIPTNITTIKHFKSSDEKDFLSYGSSSKNLYLLLLEDL